MPKIAVWSYKIFWDRMCLSFRPVYLTNLRSFRCGVKYFFPYRKSGAKVVYTSSNKTASSETQGQSFGPGEKARRKFSSTGGKAPGYRLSPDHFQTVKRMLAPDWAQKMLCIIVPNRRTASPEFFLVNSYTTAIDSITACLAHTPKKCTQESGNFQFDINSPASSKYCLPED